MSPTPKPASWADLTEALDALVHAPEEEPCCDACAADGPTVEGVAKVKQMRRAKMRGANVSRLRTAKVRRSY